MDSQNNAGATTANSRTAQKKLQQLQSHLVKLEVGQEVLHSSSPAEGKNEAVFAPTKDGSDLMLFVVEVCLDVFTNKATVMNISTFDGAVFWTGVREPYVRSMGFGKGQTEV